MPRFLPNIAFFSDVFRDLHDAGAASEIGYTLCLYPNLVKVAEVVTTFLSLVIVTGMFERLHINAIRRDGPYHTRVSLDRYCVTNFILHLIIIIVFLLFCDLAQLCGHLSWHHIRL